MKERRMRFQYNRGGSFSLLFVVSLALAICSILLRGNVGGETVLASSSTMLRELVAGALTWTLEREPMLTVLFWFSASTWEGCDGALGAKRANSTSARQGAFNEHIVHALACPFQKRQLCCNLPSLYLPSSLCYLFRCMPFESVLCLLCLWWGAAVKTEHEWQLTRNWPWRNRYRLGSGTGPQQSTVDLSHVDAPTRLLKLLLFSPLYLLWTS